MVKLHLRRAASERFQGFRPWALALSAITLTACTTPAEPTIRTVEVKVPVAVNCTSPAGPEPAFVDTAPALKAAGDIFAKVQLLLAGRAQRDARLAEHVAARAGCR